ncbi:hypothetical protein [Clostridium cibarium]|uniref:SSD domain-containing protein n=1 Tax=Clostridium cibarium TaxID=2762247 RepID=A0ABR8PTC1_9CLOT|nr:hypothetical protein [Clostridium cibarium]MBD7911393.1 hypothetical protein [Clostridium cibarium]
MDCYKSKIPILKNNFTIESMISEKKEKSYILMTPVKKYKITQECKDIIEAMDGKNTYDDISNILNTDISAKKLIELYGSLFNKMGIAEGNENLNIKKSFLFWKVKLIDSKKIAGFKFIDKLFEKKICIGACTLILIINLIGIIKFYDNNKIYDVVMSLKKVSTIIIPLLLLYLSVFIHELGHFFCSKYFGVTPGNIGFGFYFTSPVLFIDLDEVWKLNKDKRVFVNLAGLYFQYIYLSLISLISIILGFGNLFFLCLIFGICCLTNLIPFIKLDGYWVLADYFEIENLLKYSMNIVLSKFRIKKENKNLKSNLDERQKKFLHMYIKGLSIFMIAFVSALILMFGYSIFSIYKNIKYFLLYGSIEFFNTLKLILTVMISIKMIRVMRNIIKE